MFDTKKFGHFLSNLRKNADMTQSELGDKLNLTRQAISRYELGESFPDVSILLNISSIFGIGLNELVASGAPTPGESKIITHLAMGENATSDNIEDVINLAPYLKPSTLQCLSEALSKHGIDISNLICLAEYLNDENVIEILRHSTIESLDEALLIKLIPTLDIRMKYKIAAMVFENEIDWHILKYMHPFIRGLTELTEAAVVAGVLPQEALDLRYNWRGY